MTLKPKNERLAIGAFVGVFALDAVLSSGVGGGHGHMGIFLVLLAVNFPGVLIISALAPLLNHFGEQSGLLGVVIAGLFSAAFWSFIFGYVLSFKRAT